MLTVKKNDFKAYLTESIKIGGQMMIDMAEDIVGTSGLISGLTVSITFDPEMRSIPELTITRSHLPKPEKMESLDNIIKHGGTK